MQKAESNVAQMVTDFWAAPEQARFDQAVVSSVTGYSGSALEKFRSVGGGPRFVRLGGAMVHDKTGKEKLYGGKVLYVKRDVVEWMDAQRPVCNTAEAGQAA